MVNSLSNLKQDLVYAARTMRLNPVFAITAVLTLALGIGANTAVFTVIRDVLLKPLAYPQPEQLVQVSGGATPVRFTETMQEARSYQGLGAFSGQESLSLSGNGAEPEVLTGVRVSANFLSILQVSPLLGESFLPEDDSAGGRQVVLISAELWDRRFHRDPNVVGQGIRLEQSEYTVIGVLPARFAFPSTGMDVWLTRPAEWPLMQAKSRELSPFLTIFGRLKAEANFAQANAELKVIQARYAAAHPAMLDAKPKKPVAVEPWKDRLVGSIRPMLWMLFGATSFVLLITCANVASLLLARATGRAREFAVRAALGASKARLLGQVLTENLFLAAVGGTMGVWIAAAAVEAIPRLKAFALPRTEEVHLDAAVVAFACGLSLCSGVFFGLAPAFGASRLDLINVLRGSGSAADAAAPRRWLFLRVSLRGALVVSQVALSMVLLIGAALLIESLVRLSSEDVGFRAAHLLTFRVSLPESRYGTNQKRAAFYENAVRELQAAPGVVNASAAMFLPMTGFVGTPVQDAHTPALRLNERPIVTLLLVDRTYLQTLGIALRRGRSFAEQDKLDGERVAMIDEATARRFWPAYPAGLDPVGQQLLIGGVNAKPARIVGVVAGVHQNLENSQWPQTVYEPLAQNPQPAGMLAVRTAGDAAQFGGTVRSALRRVDTDQPLSDVRTMDDLLDEALGQRRLLVWLLGSFAGVALLLALTGIYGVIAYAVSQRVRELGIRRALGAQRGDILRLIMGQGLGLTAAGIVIGTAGAVALARFSSSLNGLLFHTKTTDPETFVGIALLFGLAAVVATFIPARRALRMDAMTALRNE